MTRRNIPVLLCLLTLAAALVLVGVVVGRVSLYGHAGRRTAQVDAVGGVVVGDVALDGPSSEVGQGYSGGRG